MCSGIQKIENIIDYIESNITEEFDYADLASKMALSVYEFRRIFSFVVGCPISEYIRKRKLSLAALEIMTSDRMDMLQISEKYGYSNQSAFTRAFCEQHGVAPTACLREKVELKLFTRPKFSLKVSGGENVPFTIIKTEDFYIHGYSAVSAITDSCCCENVWNNFYKNRIDQILHTDKLYVSYSDQDNCVECCIGEMGSAGQLIPASRWACFPMDTVDDDIVNQKYSQILYEWLPSANLKRNKTIPTVEVYPFDMSEDGFLWEIRIPIE